MKRYIQWLFTAAFSAFLGICSAQPPSNNVITKQHLAHIQSIENNLTPAFILKGLTFHKTIGEVIKEDNIPGVSIAFVDSGKIAWVKSYGYANLANQVKVNANTVFLAASLSKPVAATAALKLVEEGMLNMDEDVNIKLKGWKVPESEYTKTQKVTLRNLIDHKAGVTVAGNVFLPYDPNEQIPTTEQILNGQSPSRNTKTYVEFEPGTKRKYSNAGYLVIQELLADVTGKAFDQLINDIIIKPCGMTKSSFTQPIPERLSQIKAVGYSKGGEAKKYNIYPYMAPAALWTTPTDLGKFMIALLNDYDGKPKTILSQQMMKEVFAKDDIRLGFSKIFYGKDVMFRHSGANDGFTCYMAGYAGKKQGVIIMTNSENGDNLIADIERAVANEYNWEYLRPEVLNRYVVTRPLAQYSGQFESPDGAVTIKVADDKLYVRSGKTNNTFRELIPVAEDAFLLPSVPMKFVFLSENNQVRKIRITNEHVDDSIADKKDN